MEEALRIALLAMITALAAEDLDRRIDATEAEMAGSPSKEVSDRLDLLRYNRRVIEEREKMRALGLGPSALGAQDRVFAEGRGPEAQRRP